MFRKFPGGPVLVLLASTSGTGLIPDPGTKIPHATCHGQKKKSWDVQSEYLWGNDIEGGMWQDR